MRFFALTLLILIALPLTSAKGMDVASTVQKDLPKDAPYASFAGGCFWCLESEFCRIEGVIFTRSGYEGGAFENPS